LYTLRRLKKNINFKNNELLKHESLFFDILIFINAFSLDLHPVNFSLFSTIYFYIPISGIGLIEKYARVRPPLWIYPDPQTRWSCDFSYSTFLCYALPLPVGRNERFLHRGAIASTICYASVTSSSLSSVALGKKDTLPYHFFRINWWKGELNKAKHGGVCRCWPAAPLPFLTIFLGSGLMIAKYTLWTYSYSWYW